MFDFLILVRLLLNAKRKSIKIVLGISALSVLRIIF